MRTLATVLVAFVLAPSIGGCAGQIAVSPAHSGPLTSQAANKFETTVDGIGLDGEVFDLVYDAESDRIWTMVMQVGGADQLIEVDPATGTVKSRTPLPDVEYNGFLSRIKLGPDGAVWISEPYRLVRYQPGSEVENLALDIKSEDATPDALDPANPLVGTWISTFGFSGADVLVARVNVTSLAVFDQSLAQVSSIPFPEAAGGFTDIASAGPTTYLAGTFASPGSVWELDHTSTRSIAATADRLELVGNAVIASGGGKTVLDVASGEAVSAGLSGQSDVRLSGDPTDGSIVVYDPALGAIMRVQNGALSASISLPRDQGFVTNPLGTQVPVTVKTHVADIVVDIRGAVWYATGSTLRSIRF